jgi:hypothetical protein
MAEAILAFYGILWMGMRKSDFSAILFSLRQLAIARLLVITPNNGGHAVCGWRVRKGDLGATFPLRLLVALRFNTNNGPQV